jgi:hypothetical protein
VRSKRAGCGADASMYPMVFFRLRSDAAPALCSCVRVCGCACVRACAYRRREIGLTRANRFTFTSTSVSALEIDATLEISVRIGFARSACVSIRRRSADSPSPMRCGPPYPRWRWRSVAGAPSLAAAHYRVHTPERGSLRTQSPRGEPSRLGAGRADRQNDVADCEYHPAAGAPLLVLPRGARAAQCTYRLL